MPTWREELVAVFWRGVETVRPEDCVERALHVEREEVFWEEPGGICTQLPLPILVLGAGKAAARMALGLSKILPPCQYRGAIVTSERHTADVPGVEVLVGSHPLPDHRSLSAAKHLLRLARSSREPVAIFLVSGGASSLLAAPWPPVTLEEKIATHRLLLTSGANIGEVNTVRKHLSRIKGGRLLQQLQRPVFTLAISDVVGDDPATIGSGPTVPDPNTFADAQRVLAKYELWETVPRSVRTVIEDGLAGRIPETLKPWESASRLAHYRIIASNRETRSACAAAARSKGWFVEVIEEPIVGEAREAARRFATRVQMAAACANSGPLCVIAGGETTVTVRGRGLGGRNQEFALALAPLLAGLPVSALIAGTDGVDGPTEAAGAFVDGTTLERAHALGLNVEHYLEANDSYHFFAALGDLFITGPTGTNVMDLQIAVVHG
ncbi:MAG: DUF4147 domain-containing protein [Candidatus Binatia bacterium]|nr:DUF4147 domain-containing protein [Candidatus Binatia bacterium]